MFDLADRFAAISLAGCFLATLVQPTPAGAGGTPDPGTATSVLSTAEDQLLSITGEGDITANGDYVSGLGGLNEPYEFYIEVPPGQALLQVDVFDADVGGGGGNEYFDTQVGGGWNTRVEYTLVQPDGTPLVTGIATTCGICDNVWLSPAFFQIANPQPGHWQFQVDQTISGNDENAFGFRAHDGDPTAGGTEYNVYALSYVGVGERAAAPTAVNREYDLYPYITRGCSFSIRDFDADGEADWELTTRAGTNLSTGPASLSGNDNWNTNGFSGFTNDLDATDYGLYHLFFEGEPVAGGGVNNVYVLYLGNDDAAGTPPTNQPEANTYRIYLPADGSSWSGNGTPNSGSGTIFAPTRPWVGHSWSVVANAPVRIGATSRVRVTVTVDNPTALPIQFDAATSGSRVLEATVPTNGGETVYVSGSASGPGAVAESGAGPWTVTWAPGVVSAGSTATLTYDIDVTPTAAGTLYFTGDPDGAVAPGTEATFLDGTCANAGGGASACTNATQLASGTFTFGPLCQLEADVQLPTPAVVADLWIEESTAGRRVLWRTATEAGSSIFRLHRVVGDAADGAWRPVAGGEVPARPDAPQGGVYAVVDSSPDADSLYGLEIEDADGSRRSHGPFRAASAPALSSSTVAAARSTLPIPAATPAPADRIAADRIAADRIEIPVRETGWYRVEATDLASAFGTPLPAIENGLRRGALRLEHRGEEIAWSPATDADGAIGFELFAEGPEGDPFLAETIYTLVRGPGRTIEPSASETVAESELVGAGVFDDDFESGDLCAWSAASEVVASCASLDRHVWRFEEDRRAVVLLPLDPAGDIFFDHLLFASSPALASATERLAVPGAVGGADAVLRVGLQGGSSHAHRVRVDADGVPLGTVDLAGLDATEASFPLPDAVSMALGATGAVDVTVTVEAGGWVFVDHYALETDRRLDAGNVPAGRGGLEFVADTTGSTILEGFDSSIRVFDLADAENPTSVATTVRPGAAGSRVAFDAVAGRRYVVVDSRGARPVSPRPDPIVDPSQPVGPPVDYLVIADSPLVEAAAELAALRAEDGLAPRVVDVDDVFDVFAGGEKDPRAIRRFFEHVVEAWPKPPRFVVLVGTGTYDYRDRLGTAAARLEGAISPLLVASRVDTASVFPSDGAFADLAGDGVPAVALGRIPARTPEELRAYVETLRRHRDAGPWAERRLLLLSDEQKPDLDFVGDAVDLGSVLGFDSQVESVSLDAFDAGGALDLAAARAELFDRLADDTGLVAFLGHGGLDRLASPGWLTSADLADIPVPSAPPVHLALTCHAGLHGLPGYDSLGEELVRAPQGGAVAFWGPSWLSGHDAALDLGRDVLRRLAETPTPTLGEAVRAALEAAAGRGVAADQLLTFQLLGDPAVVPRLVPTEEPSSDGSDA